jgi:hypothetical protein
MSARLMESSAVPKRAACLLSLLPASIKSSARFCCCESLDQKSITRIEPGTAVQLNEECRGLMH